MPRPRNAVPQPRQHKGRAVLDVYENGVRRTRTLGAWGSSEADAEYKRFLAEFATGATERPSSPDVTVNEILLAFMKHAEQHYRQPDGTPTSEVWCLRLALKPLRELYGHTPAREFGPKALKTLRDHMIKLEWSRGPINAAVERVRRAFKWAASEEMISASVFHSLQTVSGLRAGRSAAKERDPIQPVEDAVVDATLPFLNRHVRGLVEFQRLTGCRPGEACMIRRRDIDMSGPVWLYKPPHHKNAWRGKSRTIAIGPKAQELLKAFFTPDIDDYLFSPRRVVAEQLAERAAKRKTRRWPSHMKRNAAKRTANPKRLAETYDRGSYGLAIDRACDRAFPPPAPLAQRKGETASEWWARLDEKQRNEVKAWRKAHRWHPNQLNAARERLNRVPAILKRFRQAVLSAACSGRLTADWHEDATAEDSLPQTWESAPLRTISSRVTDGTHLPPPIASTGIPFVLIGNVVGKKIDWSGVRKWLTQETYEQLTARCKPERGDVLYTAVGATYGQALVIETDRPFIFQRHIAHIKPLRDRVQPPYLVHVLNSPELYQHATDVARGAAQPTVTLTDLKEFVIPLPPLAEQQEIVRRVGELFALADVIETRLTDARRMADQLTQAVLAKAFRGELVPTEAELARRERRTYEPASELLARIRAERQQPAPPVSGKPKRTRKKADPA